MFETTNNTTKFGNVPMLFENNFLSLYKEAGVFKLF